VRRSLRGIGRRRPPRDAGSLSLEFALITPALLALIALVFAYGRVAQVNGTLEAGTRDAARSASFARSEDEALAAADAAVRDAVGPGSCSTSLGVRLEGAFEPGFPITVVATCTYTLSDLGLPGAPGSVRVASRFTSPVDPNRGVG
jgi:Flp pilus assembly protein TadG